MNPGDPYSHMSIYEHNLYPEKKKKAFVCKKGVPGKFNHLQKSMYSVRSIKVQG